MADLNYIDRDLEVKIVGQDATGNTVNYVSADANGNLFVKDYADGPVTPGAVAAASTLIGGQFNTALPTLTNTQQAALQVDSSGRIIIRPLTSADVVSAAQSGTWTTGRTWTLASGTDSVAAVQSGTWTVQPGNTANTTPWLVTDSSDGPVAAGTAAAKSSLAGGVFNTVLPTVTNGQQVALQLDSSGRIIIAPTTQGVLAEDHNYGTVGANTLRTASQVGNATGAADFNYGTAGAQTLRTASQVGNATGAALFGAGTTTAQVLRVVLPTDQTAIPVTQSGTWTTGRTWTLASGTDSVAAVQSGTWTVQPGNTANTTPWLVTDSSDGPVTPGTVAGKSSLMGGQFNTALPTLTNTQQAALQVDSSGRLIIAPLSVTAAEDKNYGTVGANTLRTASQVGNATGAADFNYGTVGAQTLRTASQIGNATGAALFGAGTTTAQVLRVVLPTDQTAIPASQSGTWTVQPGNTANTTPWLVTDSADGPVTPGTVAGKSMLIGGQFNTALPTLTNTQQAAFQLDSSGRLIIAPLTSTSVVTAAEDHNFGTVGANTLRAAAQIGNATGAADFNFGTIGAQSLRAAAQIGNATGAALFGAGTTTAQVLRVVLPTDQTAIPVTQSGTWTVQPGNTQNTTAWLTQDAADGPVTAGAVAAKSLLAGGQFNTTLPSLTNTQQVALQVDSSGRLITSSTATEFVSTNNSSTANLASAATFTGTSDNILGYVVIEVSFKADQAVTIQVQQSTDNSNWDVVDSYTLAASTGDTRTFAASAKFVRVLVTNNGGSTTTFLRLQTILSSVGDVMPRALSTGGQLKVADSINTSGQFRAQSVTTSAAEALGAATILRDRKFISLCPTNGTIYWGFANTVTTSNGTPIFKNQTVTIAATDNVHIYVIAGSTVDVRIAEGS